MIGKLKGVVDSVDEETLILDVGGVGYLVSASARTLRALPSVGEKAELLIETHVREDAIRLYGFLDLRSANGFACCKACRASGPRSRSGFSAHCRRTP